MAKLTYEQKKAVPKHLRGAGTKKWWCPFCNAWHGYPNSICKNRPGYEEGRKNQREASRISGLKNYYEDGHKEVLEKARQRYWEDPESKIKASITMTKTNKKLGRLGKRKGKNNPFYGKKHSLQTRIKMSLVQTTSKNVLTEKDTRHILPIFSSTTNDFFRRNRGPIDEFSGGEFIANYDPDEFDPFR